MNNLKEKLKHVYIVGRYPETDWHRLLTVFVVIWFFIGCWSLYTFIQIKGETISLESRTGGTQILAETKEKELGEVLDRYQKKELRYRQLQSGSSLRPAITAAPATFSSSSASTTAR